MHDISLRTAQLLLFVESGFQLFNLRRDIAQYCAALEQSDLVHVDYFSAFDAPLLQRAAGIIKQSLSTLSPSKPLIDPVNLSLLWDGVEISCPDDLDIKFSDSLLSIHADIAPLLELVHREWHESLADAVQLYANALNGSDIVVARAAHRVAVLIAPLFPRLGGPDKDTVTGFQNILLNVYERSLKSWIDALIAAFTDNILLVLRPNLFFKDTWVDGVPTQLSDGVLDLLFNLAHSIETGIAYSLEIVCSH